jgi:DNA-binding beta-propeller fold protein YncE
MGSLPRLVAPGALARRRCLTVLLLLLGAGGAHADSSFVEFESGQVRPLALSPDTNRLFAVNTPDDRLEIFDVRGGGPVHQASVPVGLEPVAVAVHNTEVWVVNHLSDSVSIVDVGSSPPRVTRTLLTCDEPRDIVFANNRAFITTARRGQNCIGAGGIPIDPMLTTPGVGRALVQVFDPSNLGASMGGTPLTTIALFGDTPRALAVSPDGNTVYAAVFDSGNQTTALNQGLVCPGGSSAGPCSLLGGNMPGGLPAPSPDNCGGETQKETGLIVKFDPGSGEWRDELSRNWNNAVKFSLPDRDVFTINAAANPPVETGVPYTGVGTVIFNLAVNPVSGKVYATNTEARNEVRFEGTGGGCTPNQTVRGHLHEARISVLDGGNVTPRHLNKHIDYSVVPSPAGVKDNSLAIPVGMAVTGDGTTLYVTAFGSSKVGRFTTAGLENDTFVPSSASHIPVSGGGPSGLALNGNRLYVLTRFDNAISVIDTSSAPGTEIDHQPLFNPEPASVVSGRPFLYDAYNTSSNGEASCAACHVFADFDSLGWDLGDPAAPNRPNNPNPQVPGVIDPFNLAYKGFQALKGPMTTQSLRGLAKNGPMHWRGDRTGGDPLAEDQAFKKFNVAFDGLLGRGAQIADADMQKFTDFILQVTYPPNPIRSLDNSLTPDQAAGRDFYFNSVPSDTFLPCNGCHTLDPGAGQFGTKGLTSFENETQFFKVPHLRNAYQKVGMFGMPAAPFFNSGDNGPKGLQVRGFGFLHDGSVDTLFRFHNAIVFDQRPNPPFPNTGGFPADASGDTLRRQVEQFILAFDSNVAPIVGQQITLTSTNGPTVGARIDLLNARAAVGECDVVAKGSLAGAERGWYRLADGTFVSDCAGDPHLTDTALRAQAATAGQELTYTCVPPGSGFRIGVDRDNDGFPDQTEIDAGTDPTDASSFPLAGASRPVRTTTLTMRDGSRAQSRKISFSSSTRNDGLTNRITPPTAGSSGDPTFTGSGCGGGTLTVYNSAHAPGGATDMVTALLPAANWTQTGTASEPAYRFRDKNVNGPVSKIVVKADKISIRGGRSNWLYTLNESTQGSVAVRLTLGTGASWCAEAGQPSFPASIDEQDHFVALRDTPAPASCPTTP